MKPNSTKVVAKATIEARTARRDNLKTLVDSGWITVPGIAKAMGYEYNGAVYQWFMEGIGKRYIGGNTARLLEQNLGLVSGSLDLPSFGGHAPSKSVVQRRLEDAESLVDEAIERTRISLTKKDREELAAFFSEELKKDRKVTPSAADTAVRFKRRS